MLNSVFDQVNILQGNSIRTKVKEKNETVSSIQNFMVRLSETESDIKAKIKYGGAKKGSANFKENYLTNTGNKRKFSLIKPKTIKDASSSGFILEKQFFVEKNISTEKKLNKINYGSLKLGNKSKTQNNSAKTLPAISIQDTFERIETEAGEPLSNSINVKKLKNKIPRPLPTKIIKPSRNLHKIIQTENSINSDSETNEANPTKKKLFITTESNLNKVKLKSSLSEISSIFKKCERTEKKFKRRLTLKSVEPKSNKFLDNLNKPEVTNYKEINTIKERNRNGFYKENGKNGEKTYVTYDKDDLMYKFELVQSMSGNLAYNLKRTNMKRFGMLKNKENRENEDSFSLSNKKFEKISHFFSTIGKLKEKVNNIISKYKPKIKI
jgi:hypothetical protein